MQVAHGLWGHQSMRVSVAVVERGPWRSSRDIARELELSQQRVLELRHDDQLHQYHYARKENLLSDYRPVWMNFVNVYGVNTLLMSSFYVVFYGQAKHILSLRVSLGSTSHLWARDNPHANRKRGCPVSCRASIELELSRSVRQRFRFLYDGAQTHCGFRKVDWT
jgi:hypothetical protein